MLQKLGYGIVIQVLSTSQCSAVLPSQYNLPFLPPSQALQAYLPFQIQVSMASHQHYTPSILLLPHCYVIAHTWPEAECEVMLASNKSRRRRSMDKGPWWCHRTDDQTEQNLCQICECSWYWGWARLCCKSRCYDHVTCCVEVWARLGPYLWRDMPVMYERNMSADGLMVVIGQ